MNEVSHKILVLNLQKLLWLYNSYVGCVKIPSNDVAVGGNYDFNTAHTSSRTSGFPALCAKMADRRRRRRRASQDSEDEDESASGSERGRSASPSGKTRPRIPDPGESPVARVVTKNDVESECVSVSACYHFSHETASKSDYFYTDGE